LIAHLVASIGQVSSNRSEVSRSSVSSVRKLTQFESETELAFTITNKLHSREGCDQVCLASVRGAKVRILSLSGQAEVSRNSPGIRTIQAALEEAVDMGCTVVAQAEDGLDPEDVAIGCPLHMAWHSAARGAAVATIPLFSDGECVAALAIRRSPHAPFDAEELHELKTLVEPYATGLEVVRHATRSLLSHLLFSASGFVRGLFDGRRWGRKALVMGVFAFASWCVFGSVDYRITAPCTLKPSAARHVSVPLDAVLRSCEVVPGDVVEAGQVLCVLDTSSLELEVGRLESELAIKELDGRRALAAGVPMDIKLAEAAQRQIEADIALYRFQIAQACVRAPTDGVVIVGDHRERIGDHLTKGEMLFEISRDESWRLEIEVPEAGIADVHPGLPGRFTSVSRPEEAHRFEIIRLQPAAEQRGGRNVIIAEARIDLTQEWLRSGMEGLAKIEAGKRRPYWVAFHRVVENLRYHFWL